MSVTSVFRDLLMEVQLGILELLLCKIIIWFMIKVNYSQATLVLLQRIKIT